MSSDTSSPSSSALEPTKRSGRKGNKKVRTGCITCKIRKVKCDEGKPACMRCMQTGRKCDGYVLVPRARIRMLNSSSAGGGPSPSPSLMPDLETPAEFRAFDYYRRRSISTLMGGMAVDGDDFWGGLVLRLTLSQPAVKHAALALSSLHENVRNLGANRRAADGFALAEYGKAIAAMRTWDAAANGSAIPLVVCVLFICIEFLMDYEEAAQLHICQGRHILSRMDPANTQLTSTSLSLSHRPSSPAMEMVRRELVPIYARLSLASFLFGSHPKPIPAHFTTGTHVPLVFSSVREARDVLYFLMDESLRFIFTSRPLVYAPDTDPWELERLRQTQQHMLGQLSKWETAFAVLKASMRPDHISLQTTYDILQVHRYAAIIWLSTALSVSELDFDAHLPSFAALLSHASSAVARAPAAAAEARATNEVSFTFETEVVSPVYWVAVKCRHPQLRRAALRLLQSEALQCKRENLWSVRVVTTVATRVIEIEEGRVVDDLGQYDWDNFSFDNVRGASTNYFPEPEYQIPIHYPPSLFRKPVEFFDGTASSIADGFDLDQDVRMSASPDFMHTVHPTPQEISSDSQMAQVDPTTLEPPFGVPEMVRVKNALIGPRKDGGVWLTTFRDPEPPASDWDVKKIFLKF